MTKEQILQQYFGYTDFREGQETLIDCILQNSDVLGIMPTGAGKSLCFQVPALMMDGITIVISPLISLMRDQVQALVASGVSAAFINSTLTISQTKKAIENANDGKYKIIYVAPERLDVPEFISFAISAKISMVTIDEAHCVSQWGQDFRPSYLKINEFIDQLPSRPVISAFTATATEEVKEDIIKILRLNNPYIVATGFDRENLYFEVQKPKDKYQAVIDYLENNSDKNGIIYCATRKTVEEVCSNLQEDQYRVTRYHAGLSEQERTQNQDDFLYDRKSIMVATNAFGMGIDKSNVNFVIHYNMPKNIESYYQEAGRAGRDGTNADCILLYGGQDVVTNQFFIDNNNEQNHLDPDTLEQVKVKERERLKQMTYYCHTFDCLRAYILKYFGDHSSPFCDNCSSCKQNFETVDISEACKKILSCIYRMKERFGIKLIIDTLRGSRSEKIRKLHLDELSTYGIMKDTKENRIRDIINYLVLNEYIVLTNDEFPVAKLGMKYKDLLFSNEPVLMKVIEEQKQTSTRTKSAKGKKVLSDEPINQTLLAKLKELRYKLAIEQKVPAYIIFSDATLIDLCKKKPINEAQMLEVSGIGQVKFDRYGEAFLQLIAEDNTVTEEDTTPFQTIEELYDFVKKEFVPSQQEISASVLSDMVNALLLQKSDWKLSAIKLTKFLEEKGFLRVVTEDGKNKKIPTDFGEELGITTMERTKATGEIFSQNFYNEAAQCYIVEHIEELIY